MLIGIYCCVSVSSVNLCEWILTRASLKRCSYSLFYALCSVFGTVVKPQMRDFTHLRHDSSATLARCMSFQSYVCVRLCPSLPPAGRRSIISLLTHAVALIY